MNKARPAMPPFEEESRSLFHCLGRGLAETSPRTVQSMYHFHVWIQFNFAHVRNSIPEGWCFQMMIISPCCVIFLFFSFYHISSIFPMRNVCFLESPSTGFCSNILLWDPGTPENTEHPHSNGSYT